MWSRIVGSTTVIIKDESEIEGEFKAYLAKRLFLLLSKQKLIAYMKKLNILFQDSVYFNKVYGYHNADDITEDDPGGANVHIVDGEITLKIYVDGLSIYYRKFGEQRLTGVLQNLLSHELVHCIHNSINSRVRTVHKDFEILKKMYKKKYAEFEKEGIEKEITMESLLHLVILFIDNLIIEGFAMLHENLRQNKVRFTEDFFMDNYLESYRIAQKCDRQFRDLVNLRNKEMFIKEIRQFIHNEPFVTLDYVLGFHVVFTLIYLSEENIVKSVDNIMSKLFSWYGGERPKKLVKVYERMMLKHGKRPVIGFTRSSVINIPQIESEWKARYTVFARKVL